MTCRVLRIGVFFDGTGNNKANDVAGRSENGLSNIAKLSELYPHNRVERPPKNAPAHVCELHTQMIYIEGVGTVANEADYNSGLVSGDKGAERINEAISQVLTLFDSYSERDYNRIIDVFGFSRGAAMARDFVNTLPRKTEEKYEVGFIGVFDTVGSFGNPGDNENWKPINPDTHNEADARLLAHELGSDNNVTDKRFYDYVDANFEEYNFHLHRSSAQHIVQLTAQDEYRYNFPLTNIQGSGGQEYTLMGAHSDIGGGYSATTNETLFFEYVFPRGHSERVARSKVANVQEKLGTEWQCEFKKARVLRFPYADNYDKYYLECNKSRQVSDDLQKVSLHLMFLLAIKSGVPFELKALAGQYPDVTNDLGDLETYRQAVISSPASAGNHQDRPLLLKKYVHKSAVGIIPSSFIDNPDIHPCRKALRSDDIPSKDGKEKAAFEKLKDDNSDTLANRARWNQAQGDMPKRAVFSNVPSKSIAFGKGQSK